MKLGDAIVSMIGDFTNMNRRPDFKARPTGSNRRNSTSITYPAADGDPFGRPHRNPFNRRHSLNLSVGVSDELPPLNIKRRMPRHQSIDCSSMSDLLPTIPEDDSAKRRVRRLSEPILQQYNTFHKKLAKLKRSRMVNTMDIEEADQESLENSRRSSAATSESAVDNSKSVIYIDDNDMSFAACDLRKSTSDEIGNRSESDCNTNKSPDKEILSDVKSVYEPMQAIAFIENATELTKSTSVASAVDSNIALETVEFIINSLAEKPILKNQAKNILKRNGDRKALESDDDLANLEESAC